MNIEVNLTEKSKNYLEILNQWYDNTNKKILNIICEPYNNLIILDKFISYRVSNNERVLYISKHKKNSKSLEYCRTNIEYEDFSNIYKLNGVYSLIILDDITFYSQSNEVEFREYTAFLLKRTKKMIVCSINKILNNVCSMELMDFDRDYHFIEPRVISTRLDLRTSIPNILYDYLKWFNKLFRNVVIYVPNEQKLNELFIYYRESLKLNNDMYLIKSTGDNLCENIDKFKFRDKATIIITSELHNCIDDISDTDLIFYFADDKFFDYKKIVFACGIATKNYRIDREVILLCNHEGNNIEQAKNIVRRYNIGIWKEEIY